MSEREPRKGSIVMELDRFTQMAPKCINLLFCCLTLAVVTCRGEAAAVGRTLTSTSVPLSATPPHGRATT